MLRITSVIASNVCDDSCSVPQLMQRKKKVHFKIIITYSFLLLTVQIGSLATSSKFRI
ncbi:hypothetical protein DOY81_007780 [Sarcophaga bullata]|nr:hypothetical protein DOY81_007780 [Sarcophaga bullata]